MSPKDELEMLANDTEDLALDAQRDGDENRFRALVSIVFRIRFAAKRITDQEK